MYKHVYLYVVCIYMTSHNNNNINNNNICIQLNEIHKQITSKCFGTTYHHWVQAIQSHRVYMWLVYSVIQAVQCLLPLCLLITTMGIPINLFTQNFIGDVTAR